MQDTRPLSAPAAHAASTASPPLRILVVEDSPAERTRLEAALRRSGHQVLGTADGESALGVLDTHLVDLVISDWRMPRMDGLELCRRVRTRNERHYIYFLLLTGCTSGSDRIAGMDAGADDFLAKPVALEELRVRIAAGRRIVELKRALERRNADLASAAAAEAAARSALDADLQAAAEMQRQMLPTAEETMPGLRVAGLFEPASVVAGDSFGFRPISEHLVAFYHLDVAGHGVAAAMQSFTVSHLLTTGRDPSIAQTDPRDGNTRPRPPSRVVAKLNERLLDNTDSGRYLTMVYGVLDTRSGRGELVQAAHPYPLVLRAGGDAEYLGEGGLPVGAFEDAQWTGTQFRLEPGDRLFLYSDGATDGLDAKGQALGTSGLTAVLAAGDRQDLAGALTALAARLDERRGGSAPADDVSVLALERTPYPEAAP